MGKCQAQAQPCKAGLRCASLKESPIRVSDSDGPKQKHGFVNEDRVCSNHDLVPEPVYNHKWDAYSVEGDKVIPVSIKTKEIGKPIELGDFFRHSKTNEDFYLHVSFWSGDKYNIVQEHLLRIPHKEWVKFFPMDLNEEMKDILRRVQFVEKYDPIWKKDINQLQDKWKKLGSPFTITGKRGGVPRENDKPDKKLGPKQKRFQAGIPYKAFLELEKNYGVPGFGSKLKS